MKNRRWLPDVIVRVMDCLEADLEKRWSLQTMSQLSGFSPHYFHRMFRSATGETPARFLERLRLERASLLLLSGSTSITELAWQTGFRNPETFARRFRGRFGVSARDYRRQQLDLWDQLGFARGQDPLGGPGQILVSNIPRISLAVRRSLGEDEGFDYGSSEAIWANVAPAGRRRFGVTLDWPGITEPGRVRQDWGFCLDGDTVPQDWSTRSVGGGWFAHLSIPGSTPVPNVVYQRLFVWSLGGRYQLRPGHTFEIRCDHTTIVHQPVTDTTWE